MNAYEQTGNPSARHLTVRRLPAALARALEREKRRRGVSLNQVVLDLLAQALGVEQRQAQRSNGLRRLAGTWSEKEFEQFENALSSAEQIDEELWR